ncbi:MAG: hypothetical protein FD181_3630 [Prolixibacteraceae bacterium]|nr:MAG: hypothetical protein FD181_3630 [Prolixibacteraceae bacterium]
MLMVTNLAFCYSLFCRCSNSECFYFKFLICYRLAFVSWLPVNIQEPLGMPSKNWALTPGVVIYCQLKNQENTYNAM